MRTMLSAAMLATVIAVPQPSLGQQRPADGDRDGGAGVRSGHIAATGATVPHPGASQSGGTTPLDKGVEHEDNKIDGSICKGC